MNKRLWILIGGGVAVVVAVVAIVMLMRGSGSHKFELTLIPFKEDSKDDWGLIDVRNGEIVVKDEWKYDISYPSDGVVRSTNKDGMYEFYTAMKEPKQIGDKYASAGLFSEGLAPVAKEGQPVSYIDKEGKEVFVLKEADGKSVSQAGCFIEGVALFENADGKWGFIDKDGKVAIKAQYDVASSFVDGLAMVGMEVKEDKKADSTDSKKSKYTSRYDYLYKKYKYGFIDKSGNEVVKMKEDISYGRPSEGLIAYRLKKGDSKDKDAKADDEEDDTYSDDGEVECGYIDYKGENKIKGKDWKYVEDFHEGYASFGNDDNEMGIVDKEGKEVFKPKYSYAYYAGGLVCYRDDDKYGYKKLDGTDVIKADYDRAWPFVAENTVVKDGDDYSIIDKKGKKVSKGDFEEVGYFGGYDNALTTLCQSDYFDLDSELKKNIGDLTKWKYMKYDSTTTIETIMADTKTAEDDIESYSRSITQTLNEDGRHVTSEVEYTFDDRLKNYEYSSSSYYSYDYSSNYVLNKEAKLKEVTIKISHSYGGNKKAIKKMSDAVMKKIEGMGLKKEKSEDRYSSYSSYSKKDSYDFKDGDVPLFTVESDDENSLKVTIHLRKPVKSAYSWDYGY